MLSSSGEVRSVGLRQQRLEYASHCELRSSTDCNPLLVELHAGGYCVKSSVLVDHMAHN